MINDDKLIDYILSVVDDPKVNNDLYNQDKISALKSYNKEIDYEYTCNYDLYVILENGK